MQRLATRSVGRVAFCDHDGPVVLPVNYRLTDGDVVFRTDFRNSIAWHVDEAAAAFEVDDLDDLAETGWSVLVRGRGELVAADGAAGEGVTPEPWPEGVRTQLVRIRVATVTGRRLYRDAH
jgi:nitroimidazol reductase NimA-like FMN-containing flavoprotein (pyridoxamine 5'-phosphate oxidase superfamily)